MKYVSVAEMIAIERGADAAGHTYGAMMEQAGKGLAEVIHQVYGHLDEKRALGLIGSGNNGGDTLVAFTYLLDWGWETTAYIVRPRPEGDLLMQRYRDSGGEVFTGQNDPGYDVLNKALMSHNLLVDGVLGTGIHLPLRGNVGDVLMLVKTLIASMEQRPYVVAVDCPSGVDCDTGEASPACIPADITVTMAAVKQGILKFPAFNLVGDLHCVGIGLPEDIGAYDAIHRVVIDQEWVREVLPSRPLDAHKSTFGVVMVVAGSLHYSGAVLLAGEAAFRSGAGWVTLAVPEPLHGSLAGSFIEATWLPLPHDAGWIEQSASQVVLDNLARVTTMLIGPGFGMQGTTARFLSDLLEGGREKLPRMVVDADGLKLLARIPGWAATLPSHSVLTPHPGEMAVLTGLDVVEIQAGRVEVAERFASEWQQVVVLKGAFTVIASPEGRTAILPIATPALARAGTGDVLAGLIAGLCAQGMDAFRAAVAGAWIHGQAGLLAADILGSPATVLAGDVLAAVVDVIAGL